MKENMEDSTDDKDSKVDNADSTTEDCPECNNAEGKTDDNSVNTNNPTDEATHNNLGTTRRTTAQATSGTIPITCDVSL